MPAPHDGQLKVGVAVVAKASSAQTSSTRQRVAYMHFVGAISRSDASGGCAERGRLRSTVGATDAGQGAGFDARRHRTAGGDEARDDDEGNHRIHRCPGPDIADVHAASRRLAGCRVETTRLFLIRGDQRRRPRVADRDRTDLDSRDAVAKMLDVARAGRPVSLGPITLEKERLRHAGKVLPIADIRDIHVRGGELVITRGEGDPWLTIPASDVDNVHALLVAISRLASDADEAP